MDEKQKSISRRDLIVAGASIVGVAALTGTSALETNARELGESKVTTDTPNCNVSIYLNGGGVLRLKMSKSKTYVKSDIDAGLRIPRFTLTSPSATATVVSASVIGYLLEDSV